MPRRVLFPVTMVLSLIGLADAWYLAQSEMSGTPLTCDIGGLSGCNIVAQSPYSEVFGIPLGVYGVLFYALVFIVAAASYSLKSTLAPRLLFWLTASGAVSSIVFIGIQVFLIKALCVYCLLSAAISFGLFAVSWPLRRPLPPTPEVVH